MRLIYSLLLLCTCSGFLSAQDFASGRITDENGAVFYANAILYSLPDSSVVTASTSDEDGNFKIENIKPGDYYIQTSMLGYVDKKTASFSIPSDKPIFFNIEINTDAKMLSTVEITARKPFLEQKPDKLVVNVEDNITNLSGNLMDVMKKVPGMIVVNDKISMAGQSNVTIMINGKTTRYMDVNALLRDMPGDNIKSIEVIHQPGAEYEAAGTGPIINIILKKNSLFGTNGSVNIGFGKNGDWRYNTGLRLNHHQGSLNIQGNVSFNQNAWYEELEIIRRVPVRQDGEQVGVNTFSQLTEDPSDPRSYRAGGSVDYDVSDKHRIGVAGRYITSHTDKVADNETNISFFSSTETETVTTKNVADLNWNMWSVNPYYSYEIDTNGHKLDLDVNLVSFDRDNINTLSSEIANNFVSITDQQNVQIGKTDIMAARLDYVLPVNDNVNVKLGGKYSSADLDNDLQVFDRVPKGDWTPNVGQTNRYLFDEDIKAVYSKAEWKSGDWGGTLGLRWEQSLSVGNSVTLDSTLSRDISKLFPSASLSRKIAGPIGANIAYSYRIDRPSYSTLNPFVYYYDPFTSDRGNQNIRPELTHSFKTSITYESQPFFNVEYKHTNDAMVEVTEQNDDTGETSRLTVNLEKFTNLNISLGVPLDMFLPVGGYAAVIFNRNSYDSPYLDSEFNASKWSVTGYLQASYILPGEINADLSGWYNSGDQEGIINSSWLYGVNLGFSKKFLNDKLKISLGVDDIFNRFFNGNIAYQNMDAEIFSRWNARVVSFRASYKFGNQHFKDKSRKGGSANDEVRRVDTN